MNASIANKLLISSLTLTVIAGGILIDLHHYHFATVPGYVIGGVSFVAIAFLLSAWVSMLLFLSANDLPPNRIIRMFGTVEAVPLYAVLLGILLLACGWFYMIVG